MAEHAGDSIDATGADVDPLPGGIDDESTILVATAGDPSQYAISLYVLCQRGSADETALVVTTAEPAERTIEQCDSLASSSGHPDLRIVDTTSRQQSLSAVYGKQSAVFIPSPGDLERVGVALLDLVDDGSANAGRHVVIRSLTPILEGAPTDRVCTLIESATGLRSGAGLCVIGLDYTAHDEETMAAVSERVDGILRVTRSESRLELDYRPTRRPSPVDGATSFEDEHDLR